MTKNTEENRRKFVQEFGCQHPDGPYAVDMETADIVLGYLDSAPNTDMDYFRSRIMQNRATYMLGQIRLIEAKSRGVNIGQKRYEKLTMDAAITVKQFYDGLPDA